MAVRNYIVPVIMMLGGLASILINPGKYEAGLTGGFLLGGGVTLALMVLLMRRG